MGGTIQILTVEDIGEINRRMISEFGGIFFMGDENLANPGSLEHLLDEIQGFLFEQELYPDIFDKAALIAHRIIVGHIFHDGNKRTGMEACRLFLEINGYDMRMDNEVVNVALQIATHEIQFDEISSWLRDRTHQRAIEAQ
jgi:death on curing protein